MGGGIEIAFVNNRMALKTETLINVVNNTHPLTEVMKHRIKKRKNDNWRSKGN